MPRPIVNADDFGQTPGINRAVVELYRAGVLTSATLMAPLPPPMKRSKLRAPRPASASAATSSSADGEPVLPRAQIPSLLDPSANLLIPTLTVFLARLLAGRIRAEEIETESRAQIQYLQSRGLQVTHVDTHKHTHMFPRVLRPILRGAHPCGIHSVRNPFEPIWAIRATASTGLVRAAQVSLLRCLQSSWHCIVAEEGFKTTGGTLGVSGTGALDTVTILSLLDRVPAGTWELVTHPG